jgi:hypothetical protein
MIEFHCWVGSLCNVTKQRSTITFPANVVAVADVITILEDLGNEILYLMEMFDKQNNIPMELNLICQFDDRNDFWAIFKGINRYKFTKVLPSVGHSYLRQIIMHKNINLIEYIIHDLEVKTTESFNFQAADDEHRLLLSKEGSAHFTGVEWWNKVDNSPFPTRYKIEVSSLKFGQHNSGQINYRPYNALLPNKDKYTVQYPISFGRPSLKNDCMCYTIMHGNCNTGLEFTI